MAMTEADIQCELAYAYLHAVAGRLGVECQIAGRISDNHAIDATLKTHSKLAPDYVLSSFPLDVQLKSCSRVLTDDGQRLSYPLPRGQYDKLRATDRGAPIVLILFILPQVADEWVTLDEGSLVSRKCAYWVSLYGAGPVTADTPTVYVPKANLVSIDGMRTLLGRFSRREEVRYVN
ncbi:MAG: DUF4365 domain-containing protein [Phycisphaerales bacterium]|nr:DUF4365 domain-containing protein [Phycisphaerales bacterium]